MFRVEPILGARLQKFHFWKTAFEPITLLEEHNALKDVKSALSIKNKQKAPKYPTCSLLVNSNQICWQWKTKKEEVLVSQHY